MLSRAGSTLASSSRSHLPRTRSILLTPSPATISARCKSDALPKDASAPATAAIADPPVPALPFLPRPLGVAARPTTDHAGSWRADMMDQETRMSQRQHLLKEAGRGYFQDLNSTRRNGGKTWIAPQVLVREDRALYFPDVAGQTLDQGRKAHTAELCAGKVSVVAMLSTRISELHAEGFVAPTNAAYLAHPSYQYIQINLQENLLKSMLVSLFLRSIRASVPPALHATYLVSNQNMEYLRDPLGMTNKHIGYVYLVDEHLRVRWAGCGDAKAEETSGLLGCTKVLLDRMDKRKAEAEAGAGAGPAPVTPPTE